MRRRRGCAARVKGPSKAARAARVGGSARLEGAAPLGGIRAVGGARRAQDSSRLAVIELRRLTRATRAERTQGMRRCRLQRWCACKARGAANCGTVRPDPVPTGCRPVCNSHRIQARVPPPHQRSWEGLLPPPADPAFRPWRMRPRGAQRAWSSRRARRDRRTIVPRPTRRHAPHKFTARRWTPPQ